MKLNQKKIKQELARMGWSKIEYARRVGVSRQLIYYYLNRDPKGFRMVTQLAKPFNIDPVELLMR